MNLNRTRFLSAWQPWFLRRSRRPTLSPQRTDGPSPTNLYAAKSPSILHSGDGSPVGGHFLLQVGIIETFSIAS
jgi:hypothetical protein